MATPKKKKTPPKGRPVAGSSKPRGKTPAPTKAETPVDLLEPAFILKSGAKTYHAGAKCGCGKLLENGRLVGKRRHAERRGLKRCPNAAKVAK